MQFDVYCDESRPDLFSSEKPDAQYLVIGSLWVETANRDQFKKAVHALRNKHKIGGEFKWQKVSPSRILFYKELIRWFAEQGFALRYRCIAIDRSQVNLIKYHENDQELGFYKFYYQMLRHWILDWNEYSVFCDFKSNRVRTRLHTLKHCLACTNLSSSIYCVQAVKSSESVMIQLCDVLTGLTAAQLNSTPLGQSKSDVIKVLQEALGKPIGPTAKTEQKFNVFKIQLQGGW